MNQSFRPKGFKNFFRKSPQKSIYIGTAISLLMPIAAFLLFPQGNDYVGLCWGGILVLVAALVLAIDDGYRWWFITVLEATLWPFVASTLPSLGETGFENPLLLLVQFVTGMSVPAIVSLYIGNSLKRLFKSSMWDGR
jgi:hypothetical protein